MTSLTNYLRRKRTAIEVVLLTAVISFTALVVAVEVSPWLALLIAGYFTVGAIVLHKNTGSGGANRNLLEELSSPDKIERICEQLPTLTANGFGTLLGGFIGGISMMYILWLIAAASAVLFGMPPLETVAEYLTSPHVYADWGTAYGVYMMAWVINGFFGWAIWAPTEPANPWLRLAEEIAGHRLTTLALVIWATWTVLTPDGLMFIIAIEAMLIYFNVVIIYSEKIAEKLLESYRCWWAS